MTHPMLGILLANRFRFAGSDRHRAVRFEPITPYPAIAFMLLYCGSKRENKKLPQYGHTGSAGNFSSFGVCGNLSRYIGDGQASM